MMSVKVVFTVEQITAQMHLTLIVVIPHLLQIVQLQIHVVKMKEIVMLIMNAQMICLVDLTIVQILLDLMLKQTVVQILGNVRILTGKVMALVMMETIMKVVNGMEETVVE